MDTSTLSCQVKFIPNFIDAETASNLFQVLKNDYLLNDEFLSSQPEALQIPEVRKVMFMDKELFSENVLPPEHWGNTAPWFEALEAIRYRVEQELQWAFHTGVCLYYRNGQNSMDFHSDYEAFGSTEVIASISLGAERLFQLRDIRTKEVYEELLPHGSLFVMGKGCQENYEHALARNPECSEPRINITFRTFRHETQNLHLWQNSTNH
ncbi:alpha-ketoglutarate-dependent dioxygenase AlkB [Roseivirga sp.]|uniref:alpha-ketoglutarate-dependent dioxygenase AlkB n=1 Tax=Roseivirga sp. TaxID=1964215 RepID=UPI003B524061